MSSVPYSQVLAAASFPVCTSWVTLITGTCHCRLRTRSSRQVLHRCSWTAVATSPGWVTLWEWLRGWKAVVPSSGSARRWPLANAVQAHLQRHWVQTPGPVHHCLFGNTTTLPRLGRPRHKRATQLAESLACCWQPPRASRRPTVVLATGRWRKRQPRGATSKQDALRRASCGWSTCRSSVHASSRMPRSPVRLVAATALRTGPESGTGLPRRGFLRASLAVDRRSQQQQQRNQPHEQQRQQQRQPQRQPQREPQWEPHGTWCVSLCSAGLCPPSSSCASCAGCLKERTA
mmetsp:Transcript_104980/g.203238  ORF Transcript_104980/g.203238 Transcript_104980/m.203238 type:complete len:290 (+) Transcript_104980:1010-1879(+)